MRRSMRLIAHLGGEEAPDRLALGQVIASLTVYPTHITTALCGVNHTGPVSALFVSAPPDRFELPT